MKNWIAAIIIAVIIIAGAIFVFGNHTTAPSASVTSPSSSPMASMSMSPSASTPAQATDKVTISNFAFSPANITVKKGTTVTWTNQDSASHTVMETDGQPGPASSTIANGQSYTFTYNSVGTFHYHCSIHHQMVGTVTVTQ